MARLIDDLGTYLQTQGIGTLGTDLFQGHLPSSPDNCVAVFETGGSQPNKDLPLNHPSFQVIVRNKSYATGRDKLESVRTALHRKFNTSLVSGQTFAYYILATSEGGHIGRDESGRDEFSINFQAVTR